MRYTGVTRAYNFEIFRDTLRAGHMLDQAQLARTMFPVGGMQKSELRALAASIDLLEAGGMDRITHAKTKAGEDTFLLGPDLIEQLKKKRVIMRRHWLDAEDYMTTPFK